MTDPPIPVVPTGQPRDFDLVLPELPPIDGPGSEVDPSGSGGADCSELEDLTDAFTTSGSRADRIALMEYVEDVTGASFSDLLQPEWGQTLSDGVERSKEVMVGDCPATFTIDGTLVSSAACNPDARAVLTLPDTTILLPTTEYGDAPIIDPPDGYVTTGIAPDGEIHLNQPKLLWLQDTPETDGPIIDRVQGSPASVVSGGTTYRAVLQIKGSYTMQLHRLDEHNYPFGGPAYETTYSFRFARPLVGLKLLTRQDPDLGGVGETTEDPIDPGTIVVDGGVSEINSADYVISTDSTPPNSGLTSNEFVLPWRNGGATELFPEEADSLEEMADLIDDYNAAATEHEPLLEYDFSDELHPTVTLLFDTHDRAIYFPAACFTPAGWNTLTINYAGWLVDNAGGITEHISTDSPYLNGVQVRAVRGDANAGYMHASYGRLLQSQAEDFDPELSAVAVDDTPDGRPPNTEPNPPIVPVGGGCRSSLDGPSSCNWNIPDDGDIPLPGDNFPDYPVVDVKFPKFPPIGCHFPDFGNMDPCGPNSGLRA